MEVVLQPMQRVGRLVHRDNPNVNSTFFDHVNNELECRFPGDQRQMMLGHLVDSVVDELSTVFRANLPDLATWRPEIARWRMKFHDGFENIPI